MERIKENGAASFALGIGERPEMSDADVMDYILASDPAIKSELDHIHRDSELRAAFNFAGLLSARIEAARLELMKRGIH